MTKIWIRDPKNSTRQHLQMINTFINEGGCTINSKNQLPFFTQMINGLEKEIRKTSPFIIATNNIKYIGLNPKHTCMIRTFDLWQKWRDIRKWKDLLFLDRYEQHKKNDHLIKTIYRFSDITIKIPWQFFTDLERSKLNFIWKKNLGQLKQSCTI